MENDLKVVWDLITALGIGLLIGIERGWKGREIEDGNRVAGIRTFTLSAILGGVSAQLALVAGHWLLPASLVSFAIIIAIAHYVGSQKREDIGSTTPVALLITFSLGVWSAFESHLYVFAVAVVVVVLLGFKPVIHGAIRNIGAEEIYAGIKLLVISVLMLPLLPDQGYGPYAAINPYWIWWMVVLITGLSFIGYVAIKHLGDHVGILLTAITGGLASSTAVTLSLAQMAKRSRVSPVFMAGVLIASSIMLLRVVIEVGVVNPALLQILWVPILAMLATTIAGMLWLWKSDGMDSQNQQGPLTLSNPFQLSSAIKFGLLLGIVILLTSAMQEWFGEGGIYLLAIVSGLMDVDAITLSLSRKALEGLSEEAAVRGIILAAITNTLTKGFMFAFITDFRTSLKLILIMIASGAAGLVAILFL